MCKSYKTCCTPDSLSASALNGTCTAPHEGQGLSPQYILSDPSRPEFCKYLTGSSFSISIAKGSCPIFDTRGIIDLKTCQAGFCTKGVDGYLAFLDNGTQYVKRNLIPLGGIHN